MKEIEFVFASKIRKQKLIKKLNNFIKNFAKIKRT